MTYRPQKAVLYGLAAGLVLLSAQLLTTSGRAGLPRRLYSYYPAMGPGDPEGRIDWRRLYDDYEHWQRA
jgi:hypothetical protein